MTIDRELKSKIKADYLMGMQPKDIAEKYKIEVSRIRALATRNKWKAKVDLLENQINHALENKIIQERFRILEKLHFQSETIIDKAFSKLKENDTYEPLVVFDSEGNPIGEKTNFREIKALTDVWSLGYSRLLRSINEPDQVKQMEEQTNPGERPVIQVLLNVGLKEKAVTSINGKAKKKNKA